MTIQPFADPITGGTILVQPAIQSPNFSLTGKTGWAILVNGDAYFFNITAQGSVTAADLYLYDGDPGPGTLTASLTSSAQDQYGNYTVADNGFTGLGLYASGVAFAVTALGIQVFTGSLADGWTPAIAGMGVSADALGFFGSLYLTSADVDVAAELVTNPATGAVEFLTGGDAGALTAAVTGYAPGTTTAESWHYVGAAGEPAFGSGWSNTNSSNEALAFKLLAEQNLVLIKGLVTNSTAANSAALFTLPTGYLPGTQQQFICVENPGASPVIKTIAVASSGECLVAAGDAGTGNYTVQCLVSLDIAAG